MSFKRVFVRGDTHGHFTALQDFGEEHNCNPKDDLMIILGDSGILYNGVDMDRYVMRAISTRVPMSILCVRGNHEDRPENRWNIHNTYCAKLNGVVYRDPEFPNIMFALDGETYNVCGQSILTIGGAYSVDKHYRLMMGYKWFQDEELTEEEQEYIYKEIAGQHFDFVMTHTCPYSWEPTDLFLSSIDQNTVSKNMERFLERVSRNITFDHWYFGHFHDNREDMLGDGKVTMLFNQMVQII